MPRVLAFCPTVAKGDRLEIWPDTRAGIDALTFSGHVERVVSIDNPYGRDAKENILYQYQKARAMALSGGYDALLTIEHDMIVPADGLQKLWEAEKPVAYGVYLFRHGKPVLNTLRAVRSNFPDMSLSIFPDELAAAWKAVIYPVSGAGFGFTLIRREVLERFPFRASDHGHPVPDMPFAQDCVANDIEQVAHFGVICGHIKPSEEVLWPDKENPNAVNSVKVRILQEFVAPGSRRYTPGQEASMDAEEAGEFARAGFLQIIGQPAVKILSKGHGRVVKAVKRGEETQA